jgi:RimJ/RimL family protein N-acetyltransferase
MQIPILETNRLLVRPLTQADELDCHRLYVDIEWADRSVRDEVNRERRREWIEWTVRGYVQLSRLNQPPYGERAVIAKQRGRFIGLVGLVPLLAPFAQLPPFGGKSNARFTAEVGLFWAISPAVQRNGYASEAAGALIAYAFEQLQLGRLMAGTEHTNAASIGVMRRLGMRIERNPFAEPEWFQVVGILEPPA